jgi:uncharacterized protein (TIRG00374 family)
VTLDRPVDRPTETPVDPAIDPPEAALRGPLDIPSGESEVTADQVSLGRRLRQPRTIISLVVPIILLALAVRFALNIELRQLIAGITAANPVYLLAAFAIFYLGFPLRGVRWVILLRGTGYGIRVRDATEIILLSWLVNCLVPAKLGDIYRAYLLKINSPVSLSRTFGTVFIERILDLFAITVLGLAAGFWSFRTGLPPAMQVVFGLGVFVIVVLAGGLLTLRNLGRPILVRLPLPDRIVEYYDRFEEGVFGAIGKRGLPPLIFLTVLIWTTEALRLLFVIQALGFDDVHIGISGAFFVALIASLLTAVPLTPAGLLVVEAGVVGVLTLGYGVDPTNAATIALVDRLISVISVVIVGSIAYAFSPLRKGVGIPVVEIPQGGQTAGTA